MQWLNDHASAISAIASILTLGVWVFYAQLLYNGYIRQRRPRIIINRGVREGLDAKCLISNMSSEAVYVQYLIAVLHCAGQSYSLELTEYRKSSDQDDDATHQGPLLSGSYLYVHSFSYIITRIQEHWRLEQRLLDDPDTQLALEIKVIAIYGSEDFPIGATRCFRVAMQGPVAQRLRAESLDTIRLNSRGQRRQVRRWIDEIEQEKAC